MRGEGSQAKVPGNQSSRKSTMAGRWQHQPQRGEERLCTQVSPQPNQEVQGQVLRQLAAEFFSVRLGRQVEQSRKASFKQIKCSKWFEQRLVSCTRQKLARKSSETPPSDGGGRILTQEILREAPQWLGRQNSDQEKLWEAPSQWGRLIPIRRCPGMPPRDGAHRL